MDIRLVTAGTLVLLLTGCAQAAAVDGGPGVAHVQVGDFPQPPPHTDAHDPVEIPSALQGNSDPEPIAMRIVAQGLDAQGLTVTDIGAQTTSVASVTAAVAVAATFTSPDGRSHTTVYELKLSRDPDGRWTPTTRGADR